MKRGIVIKDNNGKKKNKWVILIQVKKKSRYR